MTGLLYLVLRYRVWPSTVRRALDNWEWRANASGASDEMATLFALMLVHKGRAWLIETATGPRVPTTWWADTPEDPR